MPSSALCPTITPTAPRFGKMRLLFRLLRDDQAATTVEYAVVLAFIAGACIASVLVMSNAAGGSYDNSAAQLSGALGS